MLQFLVRRLVVALLVTMTVMTLAFILTRLSGDLAISIAGPNATQADVDFRIAAGSGEAGTPAPANNGGGLDHAQRGPVGIPSAHG